jgi:hypothetical protein
MNPNDPNESRFEEVDTLLHLDGIYTLEQWEEHGGNRHDVDPDEPISCFDGKNLNCADHQNPGMVEEQDSLQCDYLALYCQNDVSEVLHKWFNNTKDSEWPEKQCLAEDMYIFFIFEDLGRHCY